ncbi:transcriptional regulator [Alicyclobacillus acidoterrestris]|nr:transcriptional regulator [Alicyclobacillus acidoterrestris]
MRLEQLVYFVEISRLKSFSLAAQHLQISQPSVSQAITNLEDELGVKLFKRSRSGVTLTSTGEKLLKKAQSAINIVNEIREEAQAETLSLRGKLHVAAIPSMCNTYLSYVLSAYKKAHPFVRVEVREDGSKQIVEDILGNQVDIGLISHVPEEPVPEKMIFHPLLTSTYVTCIGKKSTIPVANPISKDVIANEAMIMFGPNHRQEEYIKKILNTEQLNILLYLGNSEAAKRTIAEGVAIGFYPDFSLKNDPYVSSGDIIPLEIEDNTLTFWFGWARAKHQHFSKQAQEFVKILRQVIQEKSA